MVPREAVLHITSCCTHHCPFCYYIDDSVPGFSQKYNILESIIDELAKYGCESILFVGGDPASHPDVVKLGNYAKSLRISTSILSNTLKFAPQFSWRDIVDAFDTIEVTIHRSDAVEHNNFCGKKGAFEFSIGNLKSIASVSQVDNHLGIVYNITPDTYRDIYNAIKQVIIVEGVNIDHVVLQRIIPIGRALNNMNWSLEQLYISDIFTQMEKIEKEFLIEVYLEDSFPLCVVPEQYRLFVHRCQWGTSGISLDLYGNIAKCCADSRYNIGNILETPLPDIWRISSELDKRRKGLLVPEKCRQCSLYLECGGGCILASELNNCDGDPLINAKSF